MLSTNKSPGKRRDTLEPLWHSAQGWTFRRSLAPDDLVGEPESEEVERDAGFHLRGPASPREDVLHVVRLHTGFLGDPGKGALDPSKQGTDSIRWESCDGIPALVQCLPELWRQVKDIGHNRTPQRRGIAQREVDQWPRGGRLRRREGKRSLDECSRRMELKSQEVLLQMNLHLFYCASFWVVNEARKPPACAKCAKFRAIRWGSVQSAQSFEPSEGDLRKVRNGPRNRRTDFAHSAQSFA